MTCCWMVAPLDFGCVLEVIADEVLWEEGDPVCLVIAKQSVRWREEGLVMEGVGWMWWKRTDEGSDEEEQEEGWRERRQVEKTKKMK